ncbi:MAG TPA: hypothetical protein VD710_03045 [Nitrososphaeraceae archaeon]|nr:hypothetical protein [Nitrososphaeraceae archaeon]
MYTNKQKQQIYKKWIEKGRPWFNIDFSKEPSYAERQIIIEMKKQQENARLNRNNNKELEKVPTRVSENQVKKFDRLMRGF